MMIDDGVAVVLAEPSSTAGPRGERIRRAKESLEIFERIGDTGKQGHSLNHTWSPTTREEGTRL